MISGGGQDFSFGTLSGGGGGEQKPLQRFNGMIQMFAHVSPFIF